MKLYYKQYNDIIDSEMVSPEFFGKDIANLSENELNELGLFYIEEEDFAPNPHFYDYERKLEFDGKNRYVSTVIKTGKKLDLIRDYMYRELSKKYKKLEERPKVEVKINSGTEVFFVDAGKNDLDNFKIGKSLGIPELVDADNKIHKNIDDSDYDIIINAIMKKQIELKKEKWTHKGNINKLEKAEDLEKYYINYIK